MRPSTLQHYQLQMISIIYIHTYTHTVCIIPLVYILDLLENIIYNYNLWTMQSISGKCTYNSVNFMTLVYYSVEQLLSWSILFISVFFQPQRRFPVLISRRSSSPNPSPRWARTRSVSPWVCRCGLPWKWEPAPLRELLTGSLLDIMFSWFLVV